MLGILPVILSVTEEAICDGIQEGGNLYAFVSVYSFNN